MRTAHTPTFQSLIDVIHLFREQEGHWPFTAIIPLRDFERIRLEPDVKQRVLHTTEPDEPIASLRLLQAIASPPGVDLILRTSTKQALTTLA